MKRVKGNQNKERTRNRENSDSHSLTLTNRIYRNTLQAHTTTTPLCGAVSQLTKGVFIPEVEMCSVIHKNCI